MRKTLLTIEALIICTPLVLLVGACLLLQAVFSIPSFLISETFDLQLAALLVGNLCGVYALVILCQLSWCTVQNIPFLFSTKFYIGVICGVIATSAILYSSQNISFTAILAAPPLLLLVHFASIQKHQIASKLP